MAMRPQAVTDSRLALDAAREFVPDLVITDIQLPHVSGLELIQLLRADERSEERADHGGHRLCGGRRRRAHPRRRARNPMCRSRFRWCGSCRRSNSLLAAESDGNGGRIESARQRLT